MITLKISISSRDQTQSRSSNCHPGVKARNTQMSSCLFLGEAGEDHQLL